MARFVDMFEEFSLRREDLVARLTFQFISPPAFLTLLCLFLLFQLCLTQFLLFLLFLLTFALLHFRWLFLVDFGSRLWWLLNYGLCFILFIAIIEQSVHEVVLIFTGTLLLFLLNLHFLLLLFWLWLWLFFRFFRL